MSWHWRKKILLLVFRSFFSQCFYKRVEQWFGIFKIYDRIVLFEISLISLWQHWKICLRLEKFWWRHSIRAKTRAHIFIWMREIRRSIRQIKFPKSIELSSRLSMNILRCDIRENSMFGTVMTMETSKTTTQQFQNQQVFR